MSTIEHCKLCGNDYDVLTEEIASYRCPKCSKRKDFAKILDSVSLNSLTTIRRSADDRNANMTFKSKGKNYDKEGK